jgi:amino acid adenylation domain-containing protein
MLPIVSRLRKLNIEISAVDSRLKINGPKDALTPEVLDEIKEHKEYLLEYIRQATRHRKISAIKRSEKKEYYKISSAQKRLYILYEFDKSSLAYNETQVLKLNGELNRQTVKAIFQTLVERHESLRSVFMVKDNEPVQLVADAIELPIEFYKAPESRISTIVKEFVRPFDLNTGPLFRAGVIELSPKQHVLIIDMHHIITDAISEGVLVNDFQCLYTNTGLPELPLQFKDYAEWQQGKLRQQEIAGQKDFWMQEFSQPVSPLQLPADFSRPMVKGGGGDRLGFEIGADETIKLKEIAAREGASVFMVLLSLYNILLGKLSNQEDIVVGIPMDDRRQPGLENVLGIFINTLAIRNYPKGAFTFRQFLLDLKSRALTCFDHPAYPYEALIEELKITRNSSRNPLFDVWFIYQNYEKITFDNSILSLQEYDRGYRESKFDIILEAFESGNQFLFNLTYSTDLFTKERIEGFIACFKNIVKAVVSDINVPLSGIEFMPETEQQEIPEILNEYLESRIVPRKIIPASYHQERLWFIDKFESGFLYEAAPVYHTIPLLADFHGHINNAMLEKTVQEVIQRYSILQTRVVTIDERPYQKILSDTAFAASVIEMKEEETGLFIDDLINHPYRPDEMPVRCFIIQTGPGKLKLVMTFHHSIADRYSIMQLLKEIAGNYSARLQGKSTGENGSTVSYAGFSLWQQEYLLQQQFHLLSYWKRQLGAKLKALELPTDRPRAAIHIYKSASATITFPAEKVNRIQQQAALQGIDVQSFLMGAFTVLLYKYCRHEEIVIGTSADNRSAQWLKSLTGPVSNLLVIKSFVLPGTRFSEYVTNLNTIYNAAFKYQAMPFDKLVKELAPEKDMSRTALFDVLFRYDDEKPALSDIPGVGIHITETNLGYGKYDLNLFLQRDEEIIEGRLVYNAEYFDHSTIEAFIAHYERLIENILCAPGASIAELEITGQEEKQELLSGLNNLDTGYPEDKTIIGLFAEQVRRTPGKIAIKYIDETITYEALDQWSARLALLLRKQGVQPDDVVGLLTGRSIETVVGMLAILKAGGAYLPVDIDYPGERIDFLISDSGMKLLLTIKELQHPLPGHIVVIDINDTQNHENGAVTIENVNKPSDCCYVIYTSGTTGKPKGVMVEHRNVVRLLFNDRFQFDFDENDVWTMFHSHCFDFSVWEIYGALLFGGKLIIIPKMMARDTRAYLNLLEQEKVTILNQTPSAFYNLVQEEMARTTTALQLRNIIFGGEALSPARLKEWRARYPHTKLVNMFGITETTVHVTYKEIGDYEITHNVSNVGKPIPTLSIYLFDEYMKPVPRSIIGELYVGGAGVSRGYLGNEELTREKFIVNPFNSHERLYRTGDLARVLRSGDIEYIGRIDHQVQLRGFRIELGEIESQLNAYPGIKECVVIARGKDDDKYLLAYYIADIDPEIAGIRNFLLNKLPDYMVPSYFIRLQKMPLTSNGKLDKQALPDPEITAGEMYTGASNALEEKLVEIWADVLKLDPAVISVNKSFFELGGHSLRATLLVNKISRELQVTIPLKEIFRNQDIISLSRCIWEMSRDNFEPVQKAAEKTYYTLSSSQQRLYFLYAFDTNSIAYNLPQVVRLEGALKKDKLASAFNRLIARHESLRTSFEVIGGKPVQTITAATDIAFEYFQANEREATTIIKEFIRPFDLSEPPLIRAGIITTSPGMHILIVDIHHIVADGVSQTIMINELAAFYNDETLPEPAIQYKDYAEWQQAEKQQQVFARQKNFWMQQLSESTALELPADYSRPVIKNYRGSAISFELGAEETGKLQMLAEREDATMFMVLLSVYNILLGKLSNKEDVVIGAPVAGRQHADFEHMIGMFVNTLALRNYPKGILSYREFLADLKTRTLACFDNQAYPYELLIDDLKVIRDTSRNPLFDSMFMFQNFETAQPNLQDVTISPYYFEPPVSKFDCTLTAREEHGKMLMTVEYSTELFKRSTIERFINYFRNIVSAVTADAAVRIGDINILPVEERRELLQVFNDTYLDYPRQATIVSLFEEQVRKNPDGIALDCEAGQVSYTALNRQADAIAHHLCTVYNVQPGMLTGLLVERDEYMLPALLGILKTGAAYVPIDPSYPSERVKYVLEDSGIKLVLTSSSLREVYTELEGTAQFIDVTAIDYSATAVKEVLVESSSLAYMIYTSGSSGRPKGVMITHSNVVNFIYGATKAISFSNGNSMLCLTTISFDIFVLESLLPLLRGMTVVLAGAHQQKDPEGLSRLIKDRKVDFVQITPSHIKLLLGSGHGAEAIKGIKVLMIGGEALPMELAEELFRNYTGKLYNMYGPTETTVWSAIGEILPGERITIGKPIANTQIRIVDRQGKLVPVGVSGELCIGGEGVGKGYWQRTELTAEKFIKDPEQEGAILYRTGDLAKWQHDGRIVYQGRIDAQVKIRGHRIEPGEIESVLNSYEGIKRSVIVAREQEGDKYLVAYYESDQELTPGELRSYLLEQLPEYMIPAYYVRMEKLPLTPNGKLDRKSLPDPQINAGGDYTAPANKTEERLVEIWSEVLRIDKELIGVTNSFFELGGHSIRAIHLINKIEQQFAVKISIRKVFENISIRKLSSIITGERAGTGSSIKKVEKREYYPVSSAQERLFYQQLLNKDRVTNNMPVVFSMEGQLNIDRLKNAFQFLINRHESLRTSFSIVDNEIVQQVEENVTIDIQVMDPEIYKMVDGAFHDFVQPFDLSKCPLMKCGLLLNEENGPLLLVDIHHIICDGLSLNILMTDFKNAYQGYGAEPPGLTYVDYACWQRQQYNSLPEQRKYWLNQLSGWRSIDLPVLQSREAVDIYRADSKILTISGGQYRQVRNYSAESGVSGFMFLLSVYYVLLSKLSGNTDIIIGTDAIGRAQSALKNVVGTFVNVLPLRLQVQKDMPFTELLIRVKNCVLDAFENQDYQYDQMYSLVNNGDKKKIVDVYFSDTSLFENEAPLNNLEFIPVKTDSRLTTTRYELELRMDEQDDQVNITFLYSTDLYDSDTIGLLTTYYSNILDEVLTSRFTGATTFAS